MKASPLNDEVMKDVSGGTQIPYIVAPGGNRQEVSLHGGADLPVEQYPQSPGDPRRPEADHSLLILHKRKTPQAVLAFGVSEP